MTEPFAPAGLVSRREACLRVFRAMAPRDWTSDGDLLAQVEEITGVEIDRRGLRAAAYAAQQELAKSGEPGVECYMGGYQRLDAAGQVAAAEKRLTKAKRSVRRSVAWAGAALNNDEVTGAERHRMQQIHAAHIAQESLEERRALRRRPAAVGE